MGNSHPQVDTALLLLKNWPPTPALLPRIERGLIPPNQIRSTYFSHKKRENIFQRVEENKWIPAGSLMYQAIPSIPSISNQCRQSARSNTFRIQKCKLGLPQIFTNSVFCIQIQK